MGEICADLGFLMLQENFVCRYAPKVSPVPFALLLTLKAQIHFSLYSTWQPLKMHCCFQGKARQLLCGWVGQKGT